MERTESNLISDSLHVTFIIQAPVVQKVHSAINSYPGIMQLLLTTYPLDSDLSGG